MLCGQAAAIGLDLEKQWFQVHAVDAGGQVAFRMLINALRSHVAEFGIAVAQGAARVDELVAIVPMARMSTCRTLLAGA